MFQPEKHASVLLGYAMTVPIPTILDISTRLVRLCLLYSSHEPKKTNKYLCSKLQLPQPPAPHLNTCGLQAYIGVCIISQTL